MTCIFCSPDKPITAENKSAIAFYDGFPVSEGHMLIVPRKHVESLFELSADEQADVWCLATAMRDHLNKALSPAGFNIGLNDGAAAGQTIMHAHVHLIPRYDNDCADPRGGVRWVIPEKAKYWK